MGMQMRGLTAECTEQLDVGIPLSTRILHKCLCLIPTLGLLTTGMVVGKSVQSVDKP